jgi:hypothetical protein
MQFTPRQGCNVKAFSIETREVTEQQVPAEKVEELVVCYLAFKC